MHGGVPVVRIPCASAADMASQLLLCLAECVLQDGLKACGGSKIFFLILSCSPLY